MAKIFGLVLMLVFIFSGFAMVSAIPSDRTDVGGIIYDGESYSKISGADVTVVCNSVSKNTVSGLHGLYHVVYDVSECGFNDAVTVTAVKGDLIGTATGFVGSHIHLAIIHVPMTPEFGFIVGALTLFGAVGIFFMIRKD